MDEFDYMAPTGKNNKIFLANDTPFLNSDLMFVEYFDVLKSPYFYFLVISKNNSELDQIFDLSIFKDMNDQQLYEWYIKRKRFNMFHNIPIRKNAFESLFHSNDQEIFTWIDQLSESLLEKVPELFNSPGLNFETTMQYIKKDKKILKRIMVYTPFYSESIYHDLCVTYGSDIEYVTGDLDEVLSDKDNNITNNSTFVFSDASKIYAVEKNGLLNCSSILIADKYGYNYKEFEDSEIKFDLLDLAQNHIYKLNFFNNITTNQNNESL